MGKMGKFLLAAALGATATALLTPLKGREARTNLKKLANTNRGGIKKIASNIEAAIETFLKEPSLKQSRKIKTKK